MRCEVFRVMIPSTAPVLCVSTFISAQTATTAIVADRDVTLCQDPAGMTASGWPRGSWDAVERYQLPA